MTEDETFRRLKKATFNDVRIRLSNQSIEEMKYGWWIKIVESMGWTSEEYLNKIKSMTTEKEWNGPVGD